MAFLIGGANSAADTAFSVDNSCRFNDGDSPRLLIANPTAGTRTKGTFSTWFKRGTFGSVQYLFSTWNNSVSGYSSALILLRADDRLEVDNYVASGASGHSSLILDRLFRDPAAWYHVVVAWDTTQATDTNRYKIYVNGVQETDYNGTPAWPTEDQELFFNAGGTSNPQHIGFESVGSDQKYFDGYLAETVHIEGNALAASSFGEFDEDSPTIWKPIDVSGLTFGDEGFYLDYEDSGDLGDDESGNTNDFAETNLAAIDQCTDSPTNNFATFNPLAQPSSDLTFSEGNTKMTVAHASGSHHIPAFSTIAVTAGKWYVEAKCTETNAAKWTCGIANVEFNYNKTGTTNWIPGKESLSQNDTIGMYLNDVYKNGSETVSALFSADFADGDIVMMAIDCDNGKMWYGLNGTWNNGSSTDSTTFNADSHDETFTTGDDYVVHFVAEDTAWLANFGNPAYANTSSVADENGYGDFEYAPPSGFLAICTKNLGSTGG